MLQCHIKSCTSNNYPLRITDAEIDTIDSDEYNPAFIYRFLEKLDWTALVHTAHALGVAMLPEIMPEQLDDDLVRVLHKVLLEVILLMLKLVEDFIQKK